MKVMFAVSALSLAMLFAAAKPAHATTTAGELQTFCKNAEENHEKGAWTSDNGYCLGYVSSFNEMVSTHPIFRIDGKFYGLQIVKDFSNGDAVILFIKYMTDHPETRDKLAFTGLLSALMEAKLVAIVPVVEDSQTQ
jgi:hypothetical protein